jgi:hypothetical protein
MHPISLALAVPPMRWRGRRRNCASWCLTQGSYVSESDYFEKDWQHAFWGDNYARLRAVKAKYNPNGQFFVRHGVGSEEWSADGFTKLATVDQAEYVPVRIE